MAVHRELARDSSIGVSLLHVLHAATQAGAFVGGEGDDGLVREVVLLEEGEHHLGIGAPPDGAADEDGGVLAEVAGFALKRGQFALLLFLLGEVAQRLVGHAVELVRHNLELVGTGQFADVVGHNLRVAHLDVAHAVVVAGMGEEDHDGLALDLAIGLFALLLFASAARHTAQQCKCHE